VDERLKASRLAAAAALGFLLFDYPLLSLFDAGTRVLGVPVLWAYLFVAWALLITLLALIVRRAG
jgi:hypothetical protein